MDNYPNHLAPVLDEGGGVVTTFNEWWPKVAKEFPKVPEDVAAQWIHRHWDQSPYGALKSSDYKFELVSWPSNRLNEIRSRTNNFKLEGSAAATKGEFLVTKLALRTGYWLGENMKKNSDFPNPIIVANNSDNHLVDLMKAYPQDTFLLKDTAVMKFHAI
jgi:hypothetical protein